MGTSELRAELQRLHQAEAAAYRTLEACRLDVDEYAFDDPRHFAACREVVRAQEAYRELCDKVSQLSRRVGVL